MPFADLLNLLPKDSDAYKKALVHEESYKKLQKTLAVLVKHSDRSEQALRNITKSLDEKNQFLENLTTRLSKYLSPQVFNTLFDKKSDALISAKRKQLTIFFSDIVNFTQITELTQPEVISQYLNEYLAEMSGIALEYGATIDKFIGDSIMIFFGDPHTSGAKEDATQCVKMAIAMQRKMVELRVKWSKQGFVHPFRVRMGINTGYCNVGNFGFENRMDYTIIGAAVNLASRLESHSEIDGILISQETFSLVQDEVLCEPRNELSVKGTARQIQTFSIVGLRNELDAQETEPNDLKDKVTENDILNLSFIEKQKLKHHLMRLIDKLDK